MMNRGVGSYDELGAIKQDGLLMQSRAEAAAMQPSVFVKASGADGAAGGSHVE